MNELMIIGAYCLGAVMVWGLLLALSLLVMVVSDRTGTGGLQARDLAALLQHENTFFCAVVVGVLMGLAAL